MKKLIYASAGIFMASLMMVSCSSDSEMLSQFSKRKYLKKFKAKNEKYEDKIEKRDNELLYVEEEAYASNSNETSLIQETNLPEEELATTIELTEEQSELVSKVNDQVKDYSSWNKYNRSFDFSDMNYVHKEQKQLTSDKVSSLKRASDIVIAIFCFFIPFVGILIYEGSVTANFWVGLVLTLLFWLPGAVFAFLVCFADVSV